MAVRHPLAPADGKLSYHEKESFTQATRKEPRHWYVKRWLDTPVGPVQVNNEAEAEALALTFGCTIKRD